MGEKITWSERQQKVIDLRNRNILVSAAAGSGKTAVLVERIITMITEGENPVDVDHLLIVTFTNAAAAEMRERIGEAIQDRLETDPDNIHLQKQMTLLHSAQITTIHSFCLHVIRNHFHRIDLDPGFRIGDEAELTLMKSDVAESLLEQHYEEGDPKFSTFIECYSAGKSDMNMEDLILQLYGFSRSYPWPKRWLISQKDIFAPENQEEMERSSWMKFLFRYLRQIILDIKSKSESAYQICLLPDGPHPYEPALADDVEMIEELAALKSYEDLYHAFSNIKFSRLSAKKDETVSADKKEQVKTIRETVKKSLSGIAKNYFYQPPFEMFLDLTGVRESMEVLIHLTIEFSDKYQAKKEEKNMVDFNDLEHFALHILTTEQDGETLPSEAAEEFSEYFEEILVDEYQDSNLVQETILNSITRERKGQPNFFMVGDVKQSIYKFRLAKPELFMDKYEHYSSEDSLYQKIDLFENYRSRMLVLDGVNYLFERMMRKELGNIDYTDETALHRGGDFKETDGNLSDSTEFIILTADTAEKGIAKTEEDTEEERYTEREIEAKAIAERIRELTDKTSGLKIWDKKEGMYRIAENRDIVILLRTMSGFADVFTSALMDEGILACADTQTGYFSTFEIQIVLNMLRILDNPRQDIPLASVLLSEIGGFTDLELSKIKVSVTGEDLYRSLKIYEEESEEGSLSDKVHVFFAMLSRYRAMTGYTSIHRLIEIILEETHFEEYILAMPGGERRAANVSMLVQRAVLFEESSYHGLFHFIRYIEKLHRYEVDFGEAGVTGEQENTVRLMSIHKSKGLEFPVVFVAGLGKMFNQQDARSKIALHSEMGIGPDFVDPVHRIKSPTLLKKVIQKQIALENLGEELRVLYVALTRAKEKLILTGIVKDVSKSLPAFADKAGTDGKPLSFQTLESAKNYMDWLMPSIFYHPSFAQAVLQKEIPEVIGKKLPSYQVRIKHMSDFAAPSVLTHLLKKKSRKELEMFDTERIYNAGIRAEIERRFLFQYPYQQESKIHIKATVTELKKQALLEQQEDSGNLFEMVQMEEAVIPRFAGGKEIQTGSKRGSLYHYILEQLPKLYIIEKKELSLALTQMVQQEKITAEEKKWIHLDKLWEFTKSDLAKRMETARQQGMLQEERPFVLSVPAYELYPDIQSDEPVLLQGIIDAYFEENGKWILVDYKTDVIPEGADGAEYLKTQYSAQLTYYEHALQQITGKTVEEKIIYSFGIGKAIYL